MAGYVATAPAAGGEPGLPPNAEALHAEARRERRRIIGLSVPAFLLVMFLVVLPAGWLLGLSFVADGNLSLANYARMLEHESYATIFQTTFEISLLVTVLCVLLGYPVAYVLAQLPTRWAMVGLVFVLVPFWTSILVRTYAWLVLLQRRGIINNALMNLGLIDEPLKLAHNFTGTTIGMVHIMLPFLILPLYASIRSMDWDLMRAAANLGASPSRAFLSVFLPLSLPGLFAGTLLVFILCLGFYVTPQILGGGRVVMVSMKIQQNVSVYFDWGAGSALGVVLLVVVFAIFALAHRVAGLDRMFRG